MGESEVTGVRRGNATVGVTSNSSTRQYPHASCGFQKSSFRPSIRTLPMISSRLAQSSFRRQRTFSSVSADLNCPTYYFMSLVR